MEIYLTNTATRQKEVFQPLQPGFVGIYTCGPTVYNFAHLGNWRSYVFADILKRMFLANGYEVKQVMNVTDVGHLTSDADEGEDKLEKGASREKKTVWEVANFYLAEFQKDLARLEIIPPTIFCRATEHLPEMIALIKKLEAAGYTYQAGGNVYFRTAKFPTYGQMANLHLTAGLARARVATDVAKESPFDFVLWFTRYKYKNHTMQWDSPWGKGFPGWHLECSAMAIKYLGERFDLHTGGIDHIPVHHTNEIAQSEAALGHPWVNYWLHNDFLLMKDNLKMAKSGENFLTLSRLIEEGYEPLDYRFFLLSAHYRSPITFSWEALIGAKNSRRRLREKAAPLLATPVPADSQNEELLAALNDDLNTPKALAALWQIIDHPTLTPTEKAAALRFADSLLGLGLSEKPLEIIPTEILDLATQRQSARKNQDWKLADELREQITARGYEIRDEGDSFRIKGGQEN